MKTYLRVLCVLSLTTLLAPLLLAQRKSSDILTDSLMRAWGTYYGGSGNDGIASIAVDASGNVYACGNTSSSNPNVIATAGSHQPNLAGGTDGFIVKFNSAGVRQWGTYYGGTQNDAANDIAIDHNGNIIVVGMTWSTAGIATAGAHQTTYGGGTSYMGDGFILKFDSAGVRLWGTYYGGSSEDGVTFVATDNNNNIVVGGNTNSANNIATNGAHQQTPGGSFDTFLAKFTPAGARLWSSYYGGNSWDWGGCVAMDNSDNIILEGASQGSTGAISTPGSHQTSYGGGTFDMFIVKFSSAGIRQWGTYYGGTGGDYDGYSITTDLQRNIYFTGHTNSSNAIATPGSHQSSFGGNQDAFLAKLDENGVRQWGTYYGGTGVEDVSCRKVTQSDINACYLYGITNSTNNISSPNAYQPSRAGGYDTFIAKFDNNGTRLWGTYYGGSSDESASGQTSANNGTIYIAGSTSSANVIGAGGFQTTLGGGTSDGFIAKFSNMVALFHVDILGLVENQHDTPSNPLGFAITIKISTILSLQKVEIEWKRTGDLFPTIQQFTDRGSGYYAVNVTDGRFTSGDGVKWRIKITANDGSFTHYSTDFDGWDQTEVYSYNQLSKNIFVDGPQNAFVSVEEQLDEDRIVLKNNKAIYLKVIVPSVFSSSGDYFYTNFQLLAPRSPLSFFNDPPAITLSNLSALSDGTSVEVGIVKLGDLQVATMTILDGFLTFTGVKGVLDASTLASLLGDLYPYAMNIVYPMLSDPSHPPIDDMIKQVIEWFTKDITQHPETWAAHFSEAGLAHGGELFINGCILLGPVISDIELAAMVYDFGIPRIATDPITIRRSNGHFITVTPNNIGNSIPISTSMAFQINLKNVTDIRLYGIWLDMKILAPLQSGYYNLVADTKTPMNPGGGIDFPNAQGMPLPVRNSALYVSSDFVFDPHMFHADKKPYRIAFGAWTAGFPGQAQPIDPITAVNLVSSYITKDFYITDAVAPTKPTLTYVMQSDGSYLVTWHVVSADVPDLQQIEVFLNDTLQSKQQISGYDDHGFAGVLSQKNQAQVLKVRAVDFSGNVSIISDPIAGPVTGIHDADAKAPTSFSLGQNYPNPFNPTTTIRYGLPQRFDVTLSVLNTLGQRIMTLVQETQEAGYHEVKFNGTNLASGVYFYRIQAGAFVQTKKLLLLR